MLTLLYLLLGVLLAATQTAEALTCYTGNHSTIGVDFPAEAHTCQAVGNACVEKRRINWETNPGFFEMYFGCGKCGKFDKNSVECRECFKDHCNVEYGNELKSNVTKYLLCYNSLNTTIGPLPVPVLCPKDMPCISSPNPTDAEHFLVGCQLHCDKLNWQNCKTCDTDLCNLKDNSNSPPLPPVKIELPPSPAPPPPSLDSFTPSSKEKESASSTADQTARPFALSIAFAAVAVVALVCRLVSPTNALGV
ncbi:hypothetical protein BOX15_Mlig018694g1 [Macrostomum lignano]|nr:hypothetical protein BOX15_Mlig018694g2 [Macrostomum lignano]PAA56929.1 hypothetical protein BOX15_Mlig018694g1 [Macrostomum lignano]